jgi:methanesulfonate monooxygenase subunit beta
MAAFVSAEQRGEISEVVYRSALFLDERRFGEWLDLTAPEFHYRIEAYSPDLRKDMVWLEHDRAGMAALIELLPKHHLNGAVWHRHVALYAITPENEQRVHVTSSLVVHQTAVDVGDSHAEGGGSRLFLVGRYYDRLRRDGERWLLTDRVVRVDTRELGIGSHLFP